MSTFLVNKPVRSLNCPALFIPLYISAIATFDPVTTNEIPLNEPVEITKLSLCHESEKYIAIHTQLKLLTKL